MTSAGPPVDPVGDLAQAVLDAVVTTFTAAGVDLPERRMIVVGELPVDEEVVGVMYGGTHVGPPGNEMAGPTKADAPRTAIFSVEIWRDVSVADSRGNPPSADTTIVETRVATVDSWLLLDAAYAADKWRAGVIASVAPNAPQGGLQGVNLALQIQVP